MKAANLKLSCALLAVGLLASPAKADILELKNGTILNGKYVGRTARQSTPDFSAIMEQLMSGKQ